MRLEKSENMIRLAMMAHAASEGISIQDITVEFNVGRRTAERMRDALMALFPQIIEIRDDERVKRWRIPRGDIGFLTQINTDDLAELSTAINFMKKNNLVHHADRLSNLCFKLRGRMRPQQSASVETDLDALAEAEGMIMQPGPVPSIDSEILKKLRDAIKGCTKIRIHYRARASTTYSSRIVHPYGVIYGHRHYLVAWCESANALRSFSLSGIQDVLPQNAVFTRDERFNLQNHVRQSFGIYQEPPFDVVWHFSAAAAPRAREYLFHPTQHLEEQMDGSLIVRFRAGGQKEMCWHLMRWEGEVRIIEPAHLRATYVAMLRTLLVSTTAHGTAA